MQEEGDNSMMFRREVKEEIQKTDKKMRLERCAEKAPMIAELARRISWERMWDTVLNLGPNYTRIASLFESISSPWEGIKPMPPMRPRIHASTPH